MQRKQNNGTRRQHLAQLSVLALALMVFAGAALAQGRPPDIDFFDGTPSRYISSGAGVAMQGPLKGSIHGKIRNGVVTDFHLNLQPDREGPNRLRRLTSNYRPHPTIIPPTAQWYVLGSTRRLIIRNVPAIEYFNGTTINSQGLAEVEAAAEANGAVGRNTFRAPGVATVDLAVGKFFRFLSGQNDAGQSLELRAEFFNLFNRTHFGIPARQLFAPALGRAVNTTVPARTVQLAVRYKF